MKLSYVSNPGWPPLAWLARCEPGEVVVTHGSGVEVADDWFCEAAWDRDFDQGDFDRTDIVAGSGGRVRSGRLVFVSAGNTVDRLVSLKLGGTTMVSNSLVCLSAVADLDFLVPYDWFAAFHSVVHGINRYRDRIPHSKGDVSLVYYDNLVWSGSSLERAQKPQLTRDFSNFDSYYGFLTDTLHRVHMNGADRSRRQPFSLLTTVSTGYDSPTVTALAKAVHPQVQGFTFAKTSGTWIDSGHRIAEHLKVPLDVVDVDERRRGRHRQVPHIAADCMGEEVQYSGAASILKKKILLTGFHGDIIWSKNMEDASDDFVRGDPSGLSLTEYRLWGEFLHCPVPFWGGRQARDIVRISNGEEMKEWDVGGDYTRPICRRIVESRGVPRSLFGRGKKAASSWAYMEERFLTVESMESYVQWLQRNRSSLIRSPLAPLLGSPEADRLVHRALKSVQYAARQISSRGHSVAALNRFRAPLYWLDHIDWAKNVKPPLVLPFRRHLFPWAVELGKRRYTEAAAFE